MTTIDDTASASPKIDPFADLGRRRRPWWLVYVAGVVLAAGSAWAWRRAHPPAVAPRYLATHVTRGDLVEQIEATGTVQPVVQVQVGAQVSGRVARVEVDFNTHVHRGDLLAEIDPTPYRAAAAQASAALLSARAQSANARANLELAEHNLARANDLHTRGLNAPADVDAAVGARDSARAQLGVASAQIAQAEAALHAAETNLAYTRITAPIDGVVIIRSVDPGQTVAASFQTPTLFQIANDLTRMRVIADVDEANIGKLHEGLSVDARVDAFAGEVFTGTVQELRFSPTTTSGVVTYPAVIDVANPENKLRPGMTATISVVTQRRNGVLRVPNAALRFHPEGAAPTGNSLADLPAHTGVLYLLRNNEAVRTRVHTGVSDGVYTEIDGPGLDPGTEVVTDDTQAGSGGAHQRMRLF